MVAAIPLAIAAASAAEPPPPGLVVAAQAPPQEPGEAPPRPPGAPRPLPGQPTLPGPPAQPGQQRPLAPTNPFLPQDVFEPELILPDGSRVNLPPSARQLIRFSPRYGVLPNYKVDPIGDDTQRLVYTGGVIVHVVYQTGPAVAPRFQEIEFATDNAVVWVKGSKKKDITTELATSSEGEDRTEVELYLTGNVIIRTLSNDAQSGRTVEQVLRAREIYYDVNRHRAIALKGDLELRVAGLPESIRVRSEEVWQLSQNELRAFGADLSASRRPAQPGLRVTTRESTLTQRYAIQRNVFGMPYRDLLTGEVVVGDERVITSRQAWVRVLDVPVLFLPRTRTDLGEPLGPLAGVGFGNDRVFGTQIYTTWDLFNLLALRGPPRHTWTLNADYLSDRGPALGTEYRYVGSDLFGLAGRDRGYLQPYTGFFRAYGIRDTGEDFVGRSLGAGLGHPEDRGRIQWQHNQDIYENGTTYLRLLTQVEYLSDPTFLEQYYKLEYDTLPNQETFAYLTGATGHVGGSFLVQGNLERRWVTETEWWPRLDGYVIGQSLLRDRLSYSARGDIGYAGLRPAVGERPAIVPPPVLPTDRRVDTGRLHLQQQVTAPFDLGPFRLAPYGVLDLAYYTQDLTGEDAARFYGGGGARGSVTLSRLYPEAHSELFNVRGLYHKVTYGANYLASYSDMPYNRLPQLDRLADDATDLSYRLARPQLRNIYKGPTGQGLSVSPLFDPQLYAIRRGVLNRTDTMDSLQVVQLEARQRLQTKRGFPGNEHIVDWLTLDLSVSAFPDADRDNFGESWAFFEYYFLWHVGDRTSVSTGGWFDPFEGGARTFYTSLNFNRPDGTNFYLGYRHTDPFESRTVSLGVTYALSRKYSLQVGSTYDFGLNKAFSQGFTVARTGTDLTFLFGVGYDVLLNNLGFQLAVVPNLTNLASRYAGPTPFSNAFLGRR